MDDPRKDLARFRTLLANERTVAAWIRTGLGALAAGVAVEKFMGGALPFWNIRAVAVILILFSTFAFCMAIWRREHESLGGHRVLAGSPRWLVVLAVSLLVLAALLALTGIWMVKPVDQR